MGAGGQGADDASSPAPLTFAYHRSIAPTLGVLIALAICESIVLHIVAMALWGWPVAIALGLFDLLLVGALVALLRSLRHHPVTIHDGTLVFRLGRLKTFAVPLSQVRDLRESWTREDLRTRGTVTLALANWPNVVIDLDPPLITRRRTISTLAHKLDAREDFAAALRAHMDAR